MAVTQYFEGFEGTLPDIYTSGNASGALETGTVYEGSKSYKITKTSGAGGVGRVNHTVSWSLTEDVWFGTAVYLNSGFYAAANGQVRLMGWTDYDGSTQQIRGGIWINSNNDINVFRHVENHASAEQTSILSLGNSTIPEATWTMIDMHQKLGSSDGGTTLTEVYFDDVSQGSTTTRNIVSSASTGAGITRFRAGCDDATGVTGAISVILDRFYVDTARRGTPGGGGGGTTLGEMLNTDLFNGTALGQTLNTTVSGGTARGQKLNTATS